MLTLLSVTACEPPVPLEVENQTDQTVTIYVQGGRYFSVSPNSTFKGKTALMIYSKYFIEGLNEDGEIIYSKTFDFNELSNLKWKIVIRSSETNPYLPLEVENRTANTIWVDVDFAPMGSVEPGASLKRRPLPSNVENYTIRVRTYEKTTTGNKTIIGPAQTIFNKTFSRNELEKQGWKIVVTSPTS
ncbi:hypothetical protein ACFLXX_03690 [Chloroflexota bacterium]